MMREEDLEHHRAYVRAIPPTGRDSLLMEIFQRY